MNPYLVLAGIRFNDHVFSEPRRLVECRPPKVAGVCAILARDSNWAPKPFQSLCFMEFGNNSGPLRLAQIPNGEALFVSWLAMPFSTFEQRSEVLRQLVWAYNPVWQAGRGSINQNEFANKLDVLERKHEEQNTQIRLLLASINRLFEPVSVPPRRPIGFLPQAAEAETAS